MGKERKMRKGSYRPFLDRGVSANQESIKSVSSAISIIPSAISNIPNGLKFTPIKNQWIFDYAKSPATKHQREFLDVEVSKHLGLSLVEILIECGEMLGREVKSLEMMSKKEANLCVKRFREKINIIGGRHC